jgi:hypothetical protein
MKPSWATWCVGWIRSIRFDRRHRSPPVCPRFSPSYPKKLTVQRWLVGLMAVVLLALGGGFMFWGTPPASEQYAAGCLRAGVILAVLWLALPDTRPLKNRLALAAVLVAAVVIVARPRLLLFLFSPPVLLAGGALAVVLMLLRPRPGQRWGRKPPIRP